VSAAGAALAEQLLERWRAEKAGQRPKNDMKEARKVSSWRPCRRPKAYVAKSKDLEQLED
jgi:hypothetical protein